MSETKLEIIKKGHNTSIAKNKPVVFLVCVNINVLKESLEDYMYEFDIIRELKKDPELNNIKFIMWDKIKFNKKDNTWYSEWRGNSFNVESNSVEKIYIFCSSGHQLVNKQYPNNVKIFKPFIPRNQANCSNILLANYGNRNNLNFLYNKYDELKSPLTYIEMSGEVEDISIFKNIVKSDIYTANADMISLIKQDKLITTGSIKNILLSIIYDISDCRDYRIKRWLVDRYLLVCRDHPLEDWDIKYFLSFISKGFSIFNNITVENFKLALEYYGEVCEKDYIRILTCIIIMDFKSKLIGDGKVLDVTDIYYGYNNYLEASLFLLPKLDGCLLEDIYCNRIIVRDVNGISSVMNVITDMDNITTNKDLVVSFLLK